MIIIILFSSPHVWMCHMFINPQTNLCEIKPGKKPTALVLESKGRGRLVTLLFQRQEGKKDGIHQWDSNSAEPLLGHTHTLCFYLCEDSLQHTCLSPPYLNHP